MKVTKLHGLGNSYIHVSAFEENLDGVDLHRLAMAVSDVRKGIGSDGLILVGPSDRADVSMRIFNLDGSEANNCGNGLRCVAKYAYERGYVRSRTFSIAYRTGVARAEVHLGAVGIVDTVTIDMGEPSFGPQSVGYVGEQTEVGSSDELSLKVQGREYRGMLVSMGNPHFVSFVEDAKTVPIGEVGPLIERSPVFQDRINVEFVSPVTASELDFRVWERGSGITFACGTGACASVAAGVKLGLLDSKVTVHLLGGDLEIQLRDGRIFMTGEAVEVMTGEYAWHQ